MFFSRYAYSQKAYSQKHNPARKPKTLDTTHIENWITAVQTSNNALEGLAFVEHTQSIPTPASNQEKVHLEKDQLQAFQKIKDEMEALFNNPKIQAFFQAIEKNPAEILENVAKTRGICIENITPRDYQLLITLSINTYNNLQSDALRYAVVQKHYTIEEMVRFSDDTRAPVEDWFAQVMQKAEKNFIEILNKIATLVDQSEMKDFFKKINEHPTQNVTAYLEEKRTEAEKIMSNDYPRLSQEYTNLYNNLNSSALRTCVLQKQYTIQEMLRFSENDRHQLESSVKKQAEVSRQMKPNQSTRQSHWNVYSDLHVSYATWVAPSNNAYNAQPVAKPPYTRALSSISPTGKISFSR